MKRIALATIVLAAALVGYVKIQWPEPVKETTVPLGLVGSTRIWITNDGAVFSGHTLTNVSVIVEADNVSILSCSFFCPRWSTRGAVTMSGSNNLIAYCYFDGRHTNEWR